MDYRALLKKYIEYVKQTEGTDFLYVLDEEFDGFTKEESTELNKISDE